MFAYHIYNNDDVKFTAPRNTMCITGDSIYVNKDAIPKCSGDRRCCLLENNCFKENIVSTDGCFKMNKKECSFAI